MGLESCREDACAIVDLMLTKEAGREVVRQMVLAEIGPLVAAQIAQAKGLKYLVVRDKRTGRFLRVSEGPARRRERLRDNEEVIEVWEKDPSIAAFTDLLNRALDKPKEQQVDINMTGDVDKFVARINRARQRAAEEKKRRGG